MKSYWIRVGPNPITEIFKRRENRRQTYRGEVHVKIGAESGMIHLQAEECHQLLETTRSRKRPGGILP